MSDTVVTSMTELFAQLRHLHNYVRVHVRQDTDDQNKILVEWDEPVICLSGKIWMSK